MALRGGPRLGHPGEDLRSGAGGGHADGRAEDPRGPGRAGRRTGAESSGVGSPGAGSLGSRGPAPARPLADTLSRMCLPAGYFISTCCPFFTSKMRRRSFLLS